MVRLVKSVIFERLAKRHFDIMLMFCLASDHQRYIYVIPSPNVLGQSQYIIDTFYCHVLYKMVTS
jgi:hypothetical protein